MLWRWEDPTAFQRLLCFHNLPQLQTSHYVTPCSPSPNSIAFSRFFFPRTWVQFQTWPMCLWKPQRSPAVTSMLNAHIQFAQTASLACDFCWQALGYIYLSLSMWGSCNCMCLVPKWEIESLHLPGSQEPPGTPRSFRCRPHPSWGLCS